MALTLQQVIQHCLRQRGVLDQALVEERARLRSEGYRIITHELVESVSHAGRGFVRVLDVDTHSVIWTGPADLYLALPDGVDGAERWYHEDRVWGDLFDRHGENFGGALTALDGVPPELFELIQDWSDAHDLEARALAGEFD